MKVAIYCRLSEEDRNKQLATDDSNSIKNQKEMLQSYAAEQGWEIYDLYSDDDYTGADRRRPEFCRLLADAEKRRFNIILCKTQSRFTRELELVEKYIHGLFPKWGIRFVSIVDNADTANKGNKKSRQINGLVNEWYLEDMSDNIRSVLDSRRENGYHIGAFALYGYQKDPLQKGHLIVDEEAAAVVREVFTLFAKGYGKTAIARMLNDRGIPNPTEYKRQRGLRYQPPKSKAGTLWKYSAIADMLVNQIYIGNMVQGRYGSVSYKTKQCRPRPRSEWFVVEGTHEPIIERELWDRVQSTVAERAKSFNTGEIGLFAKKARCAGCGYFMRSSKNRGRYYLQCTCRYVAKDACEGAFISVDRLEQTVLSELRRLTKEYLDKDELERNVVLCNNLQERKEQLSCEQARSRKKLEDYAKGIRDLYLDKIKGVLTESDYSILSRELTAERDRLGRVITDYDRQIREIEEQMAAGDDRRERIEQYLEPEHLTREMVVQLVDYVTVGRRIEATRDVPIEIHWNF